MMRLEFPPMLFPYAPISSKLGRKTFTDFYGDGLISPNFWTAWQLYAGALPLSVVASTLTSTGAAGTFAGLTFNNQVSRNIMAFRLEVPTQVNGVWIMFSPDKIPSPAAGDIGSDYVRIGINGGVFFAERQISGIQTVDFSLNIGQANASIMIEFGTLAANVYSAWCNGQIKLSQQAIGLLAQSGYISIFMVGPGGNANDFIYVDNVYGGVRSGF